MSVDDHNTQTMGTLKARRAWEIVVALFVIVFLGWAVYSFVNRPPSIATPNNTDGTVAGTPEPMTREELLEQMSQKAPEVTAATEVDRERLLEEMSQGSAPSAGAGSGVLAPEAPTPTATPEDRARLLELMNQQNP